VDNLRKVWVIVAALILACGCVGSEITQEVNGTRKDMEITADVLHVNGSYNRVVILNDDVHLITVEGLYNEVFYPEGAAPIIIDTGKYNTIKVNKS